MGEAKHDRVSDEGRLLGRLTAAMADGGRARLVAAGIEPGALPSVRDAMCASCACRAGTVPNGCLQTQLDLLKAVVEGAPFLCHAPKDGRMCAGFIAVRAEHVASPMPAFVEATARTWTYSPPDPE